jgi:hypothetical protein
MFFIGSLVISKWWWVLLTYDMEKGKKKKTPIDEVLSRVVISNLYHELTLF